MFRGAIQNDEPLDYIQPSTIPQLAPIEMWFSYIIQQLKRRMNIKSWANQAVSDIPKFCMLLMFWIRP